MPPSAQGVPFAQLSRGSHPNGATPFVNSKPNLSNAGIITSSQGTYFSPSPLTLRSDFHNPMRLHSSMNTLGKLRDSFIDFFRDKLRVNGQGVEVSMMLGSYPGFLNSQLGIAETIPESNPGQPWKVDQKPDFNLLGNAETILRQLAPFMGWSDKVLQKNIKQAERGMVYYNTSMQTPFGAVPFKLGILDTEVWRRGNFYFDLRASMLPTKESYAFFGQGGENPSGALTQAEFQNHLLEVQAELLGHTLSHFWWRKSLSAEDIIAQRYTDQFARYEFYRFFDWFKGSKQRERYEKAGLVDGIIVPGLREYLIAHSDLIEVSHPENGNISPQEISEENFRQLNFRWKIGWQQRLRRYGQRMEYIGARNFENAQQTWRNIVSNFSSRKVPGSVNWFNYIGRKIGRGIGVETGHHSRAYSAEASRFKASRNEINQRLGRTENPISQMIILAGYGAGDESDPKVLKEMIGYAEAEMSKGKQPNVLFRGNAPSKFTLPIAGVPAIAYRFIDALRSPAIQNVVVVGTADVGVVLKAFQEHFANEIRDKGMKFHFVEDAGGFGANVQKGIDALPSKGDMAVLSFGDTPRIDIENVAHHSWRHSLDYIFGANGRDMVLDPMGMNFHYEGIHEGVGYPLKEGNVQGVRMMPRGLWEDIFANRKSVGSGPWGKVKILFRHLFKRPYDPNTLDIPHLLGHVAFDSGMNALSRFSVGRRPPLVAANIGLAEGAIWNRLDWMADFRPSHMDSGALVDLDGVRDYAVALALSSRHPHPHQNYENDFLSGEVYRVGAFGGSLMEFAHRTLPKYQDELPLLEGTPQKINSLYEAIREGILAREAERPEGEKLGLDAAALASFGFDPDLPPFLENGEINQAWIDRVISPEEMEGYVRAFEAYDNRVQHALDLKKTFTRWWYENQHDQGSGSDAEKHIEPFVLEEFNRDPELYRGLILEWDFSRLRKSVTSAAKKRFGDSSPEVEAVETYFARSIEDKQETPLRRALGGFKAVDAIRRPYHTYLSPSEFELLYPHLVEMIGAAESVAGNGEKTSYLRHFFAQAQQTADSTYVRKVGESPPSYRGRGVGSFLPHSNSRPPLAWDDAQNITRVDGAALLPQDIELLARRLQILPSRVPHLIAQAAKAQNRTSLERISSERMSFDRLLAWTQTKEGQAFLRAENFVHADTPYRRFQEAAPGLVGGILMLYPLERSADELGLSSKYRPHERFMFVVGGSHLVNGGISSINEVIMNRLRGESFDFVTQRAVSAGSSIAMQFSFEARDSLPRAIGAAFLRDYQLTGSLPRMAWNGVRGLATLPVRSAWGMGAGLMSAALVDRLIGERLEQGSMTRNILHTSAFFAPDLYRLAVGNRGALLFESGMMRYASRAFAVGFMADMAFLGISRLTHSSDEFGFNQMIYQQANQLHDRHERHFSRLHDGAFEMLSPSLAAWWDSVDFDWNDFKFVPNQYQNEVRAKTFDFAASAEEQGYDHLRRLVINGSEAERLNPEFYRRVDLDSLTLETTTARDIELPNGRRLPVKSVWEQISDPKIYQNRIEGRSREEQVLYVQNQFRGFNLSKEDVENIFDRISNLQVRKSLGELAAMQVPGHQQLSVHFKSDGRLKEGHDRDLLASLFPDSYGMEQPILVARKAALAAEILRLSEAGEKAERKLKEYLGVAQKIGLIDAYGNLTDPQIAQSIQIQPSLH